MTANEKEHRPTPVPFDSDRQEEIAMRQGRNISGILIGASILLVLGLASGNPVIAQNNPSVIQAGGATGSSGQGFAVALDGAGNSYVTGAFSGTVTFGSGASAVSK